MNYYLTYLIGTLLRFFPVPTKPRIIKIGNPDRNSPVLLTGNFTLTVEVVKQHLKGLDLYLLVANSKGINVWCAATGGHLNNHSVISILKTSGIEDMVDHRKVILPQLAATGVERAHILKETKWHIYWGPADIKHIREYLDNNFSISMDKHKVEFPVSQRVELSIAFTFAISIIVIPISYLISSQLVLPLVITTLFISLLSLTSFPFYHLWLANSKIKGIMNPKRIILQLIFFGIAVILFILINAFEEVLSPNLVIAYLIGTFILALIVTFDLMGMTPIYKSDLHQEAYEIYMDTEKCKIAGFCETVCPRNCFEVDRSTNIARIAEPELCVKCGACIVNCPFDALYFKYSDGDIIPPETIRRYKINMLGERKQLIH